MRSFVLHAGIIAVAALGWVDATDVRAQSIPSGAYRDPSGDTPPVVYALDEVNAYRAARGLRPFVYDDGLAVAAGRAASFRARRLMFGHVMTGGGDFQFLPPGAHAASAGCAAYPDHLGWMSCCAGDNYRFAGAAWARGRDGKRYMHLFVR